MYVVETVAVCSHQDILKILKGLYLICFQVITLRHRLITSGQETDVVTKVIWIQMNILFSSVLYLDPEFLNKLFITVSRKVVY